MLWNVNSQEIYTSGSKALKKSLHDLGLTGKVTFMGVRKVGPLEFIYISADLCTVNRSFSFTPCSNNSEIRNPVAK